MYFWVQTWCHGVKKKQTTMSRSTTEVVYRSLANTVAGVTWIQSLLGKLQAPCQQQPVIYCDNLSTVLLIANPVLHARTKHLELDLFFVREKVQRKEIVVQHVGSHLQIADGLTKPLSGSKFQQFRDKLNVIRPDDLSLREVKKEK